MTENKVGITGRLFRGFNDLIDRIVDASTPDGIAPKDNTVASLYTDRLSNSFNEPRVHETLGKK